MQLTGGYRPKLNVATKAGMFTPFLGTKKAQKNIHVCWFNTPLAFWKTQKRIPLYPCWSYHVISVLTGVPNFLFPTPNLHNSRTVCCLNMPKPTQITQIARCLLNKCINLHILKLPTINYSLYIVVWNLGTVVEETIIMGPMIPNLCIEKKSTNQYIYQLLHPSITVNLCLFLGNDNSLAKKPSIRPCFLTRFTTADHQAAVSD